MDTVLPPAQVAPLGIALTDPNDSAVGSLVSAALFTITADGALEFTGASAKGPGFAPTDIDKFHIVTEDVFNGEPGAREACSGNGTCPGPFSFGSLASPTVHVIDAPTVQNLLALQAMADGNVLTVLLLEQRGTILGGGAETFYGIRLVAAGASPTPTPTATGAEVSPTPTPTPVDPLLNEVMKIFGAEPPGATTKGQQTALLEIKTTPSTALTGFSIVFFGGLSDTVYESISLAGFTSNPQGYVGIPISPPDAFVPTVGIAIVRGNPPPVGTSVATVVGAEVIVDAVVIKRSEATPDDEGLAPLVGEPDLFEEDTSQFTFSLQRLPDASGGPRTHMPWRRAAPPTLLDPNKGLLINEVDAIHDGLNTVRVEITTPEANQSLDGHTLVIWDGNEDVINGVLDLDGLVTGTGRRLVVTPARTRVVTTGTEAEAVGLYRAEPSEFTASSAPSENVAKLSDALVYRFDGDADPDPGLGVLMFPGLPQPYEGAAGDPQTFSNQRCPDEAGSPMSSLAYLSRPESLNPLPNPCGLVVTPTGGVATPTPTPTLTPTPTATATPTRTPTPTPTRTPRECVVTFEALYGAAPARDDPAARRAVASDRPSNLYVIDKETAAVAADIGPIGITEPHAIAGLSCRPEILLNDESLTPANATLFGTTSLASPTNPRRLVRIGLRSAAVETVVGELDGSETAGDIVFHPERFLLQALLFGWLEPGSDDLGTIDVGSGLASTVEDSTLATTGAGLAYELPGDTLVLAGTGEDGDLHTIDPDTGAVLGSVALTGGSGNGSPIVALDFDELGDLYGVRLHEPGAGEAPPQADLLQIDPTTGAITEVGRSVDGLTAIAFCDVCIPPPTASCEREPDGVGCDESGKKQSKCQVMLKKAAAKFVGKKLSILEKCIGAIAKCVQTKEPGAAQDRCVGRARSKCTKALGAIGDVEGQLLRAVVKKCAPDDVALTEMLDDERLGFGSLAADCHRRFGVTLLSVDDIARCLVARHECLAERLFAAARPRAGELIRVAGVARELRDQLTCLPDHGGGGEAAGDVKTVGKPLERCSREIVKAMRKLVLKRLQGLARCGDALFDCDQQKPGDLTCVARASRKCDKAFAAIAKQGARFDAALGRKCGDSFATLRAATGGHVDALVDECDAMDVTALTTLGDYQTCIGRHVECAANDLVRFQAPRLVSLLATIGRDADVQAPFCPAP